MMKPPPRNLWAAILWSGLWLNVSEVVRYLGVVMPAMRTQLALVPDVAPMTFKVFALWGLWDTMLLALVLSITALSHTCFGADERGALIGGSLAWLFFPLFWLAMLNMNLTDPAILAWTLPWSWIECVVTAMIFTRLLGSTRTPLSAPALES